MIYKNSSDPVFIKKIQVNVWSLRDEIEEVIERRLQQQTNPEDPAPTQDDLKNIIFFDELSKEYNNVYVPGSIVLAPPPEDPFEAEMRRSLEQEKKDKELLAQKALEPQTPDAADSAPPSSEAPAQAESEAEAMAKAMTAEAEIPSATSSEPVIEVPAQESPGVSQKGEVITIIQRQPKIAKGRMALGRLILSEIDSEKISLFVDKKFIEGQSIKIELLIPRRFIVSANVSFCRKFSIKSRVIRETRLVYRMVAKFSFERPGEKTLLRQFLKSITPELGKSKKSQSAAGGGGELDDLDL